METIIILSIFALFLYFGYKDDFKRNPNEFSRTLIGTILTIISTLLGIFVLISFFKKWLKNKKELPENSDKTEEN